MPDSTPAVSVVIPAFHKAAPLMRAIKSVQAQTFRDFELHVVDDSGNENLRPLVESFAGVTYTPQPSQGPGAARNRGLGLARGRYVVSLDHDDEWDTAFLERAVAAITQLQADVVWVNFRIQGIRDRADCLAASPARSRLFTQQKDDVWLMKPTQARKFFLGRMAPLSNSALLFRTEALRPGWYEKAMMADDWLLMARLLMNRDFRAGVVAAPLWTKHEDGSHRSMWSQETGRRCVHDITHAWNEYAPAFDTPDRDVVRLYLANLHYKLAYHCFWAGDSAEAWQNVKQGRKLAGVTGSSLQLVLIYALRKLARAAGLPPLSSLRRRSQSDQRPPT